MKTIFVSLLIAMGLILPSSAQDAPDAPTFKPELVVEGDLITSIVWAPDGRMFWTEKDGFVRVASPDLVKQEDPVLEVQVANTNEQGLESMVLDPAFDENHYFYIYYTRPPLTANALTQNVVVRYQEQDGKAINPLELFHVDIPNNELYRHNGGRLKFGPVDHMFYLSVGDLGAATSSKKLDVIPGKIHRFILTNNQLFPAAGNPYPGNSIWAFGLRNTFAFTFDPETGYLFATENGPNCDDEINLIVPGLNYGWTENLNCDDSLAARQAGGQKPLISWTPTIAPTGIMIYDGDIFPDWKGDLFFCSFKEGSMFRVKLNETRTQFDGDPVAIPNDDKLSSCFIELEQGPDGYIYYSSLTGMYRLVPAEAP